MKCILSLLILTSCSAFAVPAGRTGANHTFFTDRTTTGYSSTTGVRPWGAKRTFMAKGTTTAGAGAATIIVYGSDVDTPSADTHWVTLGTITLTLGTTETVDGFASDSSWKWIRARVSAISGTNGEVDVYMGTE